MYSHIFYFENKIFTEMPVLLVPFSVSKLEGFISNREQSYEDPIEE
jgi:hypothetical protein